jgi:hypothetical protein
MDGIRNVSDELTRIDLDDAQEIRIQQMLAEELASDYDLPPEPSKNLCKILLEFLEKR